jgi:hypothetical protein
LDGTLDETGELPWPTIINPFTTNWPYSWFELGTVTIMSFTGVLTCNLNGRSDFIDIPGTWHCFPIVADRISTSCSAIILLMSDR